jgi:hypothetical protein
MMTTSKELERKAERVRERLSDRLADLRYHVSPSTVVSDLLGVDTRGLVDDLVPRLARQARSNPIAFGLIAAGVGWLIFSEMRGPLVKLTHGAFATRTKSGTKKKRRRSRSSRKQNSSKR